MGETSDSSETANYPDHKDKLLVVIKGNVGKQDSIKYKEGVGAKSGKAWQMLKFSVKNFATQEWVNCIAWNALAKEHCDLTAGSKVTLHGEFQERIYNEKKYVDFVCADIEVHGKVERKDEPAEPKQEELDDNWL